MFVSYSEFFISFGKKNTFDGFLKPFWEKMFVSYSEFFISFGKKIHLMDSLSPFGKRCLLFFIWFLPFIKVLFTNFLIVLHEQTVKIIFSRSNYLFSVSEKYYKRTVFSILKSFNNC